MVSNTRSWGKFFLSFRGLNRKWEEQAFMISFQRLITEESFLHMILIMNQYPYSTEKLSKANQ